MNFEIFGRPVNLVSVVVMIALVWGGAYVIAKRSGTVDQDTD